MIKEQEAGLPTAVVCRRHGISPSSFYKLKARVWRDFGYAPPQISGR
ncbi:MAG: transposase [Alphaproteobacteria bacterium]|nr:transposase [Alphaproteobacteria bacterium]